MTVYMKAPGGQVFSTDHPEYHKGYENPGSGARAVSARREYCKAQLRKAIKPGSTVYTLVRTVSASGMSRQISLFIVESGAIRCIDSLASDAMGYREGNEGIRISGCGMDMRFSMVYALGRSLFPEGFGTLGIKGTQTFRAETPAAAKRALARGYAFRGRNGSSSGWDMDGGYALAYSSL